jgi:hypothetical protein
MPEAKGNKGKGGSPQGIPRKEPVAELIPAHPLTAREAILQVVLLLGIPLVLLILARFALRQFFPSLGY